jgi:hypothetical protein
MDEFVYLMCHIFQQYPQQYILLNSTTPSTDLMYQCLLADPVNADALIGFTTAGHTGTDVNLYAMGVPLNALGTTPVINNFQVGQAMLDSMGLTATSAAINKEYLGWTFPRSTQRMSTRESRKKWKYHDEI